MVESRVKKYSIYRKEIKKAKNCTIFYSQNQIKHSDINNFINQNNEITLSEVQKEQQKVINYFKDKRNTYFIILSIIFFIVLVSLIIIGIYIF